MFKTKEDDNGDHLDHKANFVDGIIKVGRVEGNNNLVMTGSTISKEHADITPQQIKDKAIKAYGTYVYFRNYEELTNGI